MMGAFEEIQLAPGESTTTTFTVPQSYAGETFEMGCFQPDHYESDMKATLVVD